VALPQSREEIDVVTDHRVLLVLICDQQFPYWYDPCGKSGHDQEWGLTDLSMHALRRARHVLGFCGCGGREPCPYRDHT